MTAIIKTTMTTQTPSMRDIPMLRAVFLWLKRRWTLFKNRRTVLYLNELDDHLLRDIGLQRQDIHTALNISKHQDPTHILKALADAHERFRSARNIC